MLVGVGLGALLGVIFGTAPFFPFAPGLSNGTLGDLGLLVIRLLKALAVPLILFAILDAFARTRIEARAGLRLIAICLVNVTVAMSIGLLLMNTLRPGYQWRGKLESLAAAVTQASHGQLQKPKDPGKATLDPLKNVQGYVPESLVDPFTENNVISVVLLAVLGGAALRRVKDRQLKEADEGGPEPSIRTVERFIEAVYAILVQILEWIVAAIPLAVLGVVASVVGRSGLGIFSILGTFLGVILLGLALHSLVYYPLVAWAIGKKSPREYLGKGSEAIMAGLSMNSSLASVPLTLKGLSRMGVSDRSARLAACVGTNLNNDGITLYEAMAALFLAQAIGMNLGLGQQFVVILASIMAGVGVAGIPEAGLVVLPLVLAAAGLPAELIAVAIPLIIPVDWIIARCRSAVNVMSDMLVAILLDATGGKDVLNAADSASATAL